MKLSIIVPAFNEERTIEEAIKRVKAVNLSGIEKEIIVIDDGSTDGMAVKLEKISGIIVIRHSVNLGKGVSVRNGFASASGDIAIIQDADLEYDPLDYAKLAEPILSGRADVVYGSRFVGDAPHRVLLFHHYMANRLITFLSDLFTNLNLSDVETGYKAFSRGALKTILPYLSSPRFGVEIEITALVARLNLRVYEVGVSYHGRTYAEGKKIKWTDGLAAIWHIIKYNLLR